MKHQKFTLLLLLLLVAPVTALAKDWRDIKPLRSTCADVKRMLKVNHCTFPMTEYNLPEFRVHVYFSEDQICKDPNNWRVPSGTVIGLVVLPLRKMLPGELGIDLTKYKNLGARDVVGLEGYENREEGISVELFNGFILEMYIFPTVDDKKLRCKSMKNSLNSRV